MFEALYTLCKLMNIYTVHKRRGGIRVASFPGSLSPCSDIFFIGAGESLGTRLALNAVEQRTISTWDCHMCNIIVLQYFVSPKPSAASIDEVVKMLEQ